MKTYLITIFTALACCALGDAIRYCSWLSAKD